MGILESVVADLIAEGDSLSSFLRDLDSEGWRRPTPSPGWSVADQVAHLAWTDSVAILAMTDPGQFASLRAGSRSSADSPVENAVETAALPPGELLSHWESGRGRLAPLLFEVAEGTRIPWFGPPMSPASMATARLMETWAHGVDIRATFGVDPPATARLRNVAHIGVVTRDFAYAVNGLEPDSSDVFVSLSAPDGSTWTWGPPSASQSVVGPALDFCLVVTRRRHPDDVALTITGSDARQWMSLAQAFAGPPGPAPSRT